MEIVVTFNMRFPGETLSVHCQNVTVETMSTICIDFIHSAICSYIQYPQVPIVLVFCSIQEPPMGNNWIKYQ